MYNERENKGKDEGKHCKREAKGEQVKKLNLRVLILIGLRVEGGLRV